MQILELKLIKLLFFVVFVSLLGSCGGTPAKQESTKKTKGETPEEKAKTEEEEAEEEVPEITEDDVKELLNLVIKTEDYVRTFTNDTAKVVENGPSYPLLKKDFASKEDLIDYLEKVYSEEATDAYIENLGVTETKEGRLAGEPLYFYTQRYAPDRTDLMEVKFLKEDDEEYLNTYQVILPQIEFGKNPKEAIKISDRMDTLQNVKVVLEEDVWKIDVMFENLKEDKSDSKRKVK